MITILGTSKAKQVKPGIFCDCSSDLTQHFHPDFIFYQAGVDVLATDKLGRLRLTKAGCKRRDQCVLEFAHREQIPMVVCMGGGYSPNIKDIIDAHANTFKLAQQIFF